MSTHLQAALQSDQRDNDYFTSTIVGMPTVVALGKVFTKRKLSQHPSISIDAITAAVWHSDAAHALLLKQVKQSPKTLGLPFPAGSFARQQSRMAEFLAFLLGFGVCAALGFAYVYVLPSQPWLQKLLGF